MRGGDDQHGAAGASARREYQRRRRQREQRTRARYGGLGVAMVRLLGDPAATQAWKQGADGETRTAIQMARHLRGRDVVLLHDRRRPGRGRANLDHLAIGPGGVMVIDTKSSRGRIELKTTGGIFSARREQLLINGYDRTRLLDSLERQTAEVKAALTRLGYPTVEVRGALCYPNIDRLPLFRQLRTRNGISIDSPRGIAKIACRRGPLSPELVELLAERLACRFPPA